MHFYQKHNTRGEQKVQGQPKRQHNVISATWVNLEVVILSEVSHSLVTYLSLENDKSHMISLISNLKKWFK